MSALWQKLGAGRYAMVYHDQRLEIVRNPDWPNDSRRYQATVNGEPVETPKSALKSAQTAAMDHVLRYIIDPPKSRDDEPEAGRSLAVTDADFAEVGEEQAVREVTFTLTGTMTEPDEVAFMTALQSTLELLREVSDVRCTVRRPEVLEL